MVFKLFINSPGFMHQYLYLCVTGYRPCTSALQMKTYYNSPSSTCFICFRFCLITTEISSFTDQPCGKETTIGNCGKLQVCNKHSTFFNPLTQNEKFSLPCDIVLLIEATETQTVCLII